MSQSYTPIYQSKLLCILFNEDATNAVNQEMSRLTITVG